MRCFFPPSPPPPCPPSPLLLLSSSFSLPFFFVLVLPSAPHFLYLPLFPTYHEVSRFLANPPPPHLRYTVKESSRIGNCPGFPATVGQDKLPTFNTIFLCIFPHSTEKFNTVDNPHSHSAYLVVSLSLGLGIGCGWNSPSSILSFKKKHRYAPMKVAMTLPSAGSPLYGRGMCTGLLVGQ